MNSWKLEPRAVSDILQSTASSGEAMGEKLNRIASDPMLTGECLKGAVINPGGMAGVINETELSSPRSLDSLLAEVGETVKELFDHVRAGLQGVSEATGYYVKGDEDMASRFQNEIVRAANSGDPYYFDEWRTAELTSRMFE